MQRPAPDLSGYAVKRYREQELQLSQTDLAWLAGVSRNTISNLETSRVTVDERTWYRIRTALALPPAEPGQARIGEAARPVISADAVQGILAAILSVREGNRGAGHWAAARWRRLVGELSSGNHGGSPEAVAELSWLAREIVPLAPADTRPAIDRALRAWGWNPRAAAAAAREDQPALPDSLPGRHREQPAPLLLGAPVDVSATGPLDYRDELRGFERLPAAVRDLLAGGLVTSFEVTESERARGVSCVGLVIARETDSGARGDSLAAAHRWSEVLEVARYLVDRLPPGQSAHDLIGAVEYALRARAASDSDQLVQQARSGYPLAMYELSRLYEKSGRPDLAEVWLRRSADAGHPGGLYNLGRLAFQGGRLDDAELCLRKAADAGHPDALFTLWQLKQEYGLPGEAETWLRRAAQARHRDAMFTLSRVCQEDGRAEEAEHWLRESAGAGHPAAQQILADQARESGRSDEADQLLWSAAQAGDTGAMRRYEGNLYERQQSGPAFR